MLAYHGKLHYRISYGSAFLVWMNGCVRLIESFWFGS